MAENWQLKAVLSANSAGMVSALKSVNTMAKSTRKYLGDVASSASNLAGKVGLPLGIISGAMAGLSLAGIQKAVMGFAQLGDEVHKSAQRIGISTDEYQRIKYVAGQSGVAAEELGSSMGRLNKNIAEAASGNNKNLASLFARAGISMRGANGELRAATDLLPEVAGLFARNGNAATQARMGNAIFGKSWQALAPLLQGGKQGIDELNDRYKMLGTSMEENAIVAGEKFGDQMDDLKQVTSSYGHIIGAKLLPVLSPLIEQTIKWAVANRGLITANVSAFISDMASSLAKVDWSGVIKGIGDFVTGAKDFIVWVGGAKNALIGLVAFINLQTIMALFGLIGALGRAGFAFLGMSAKAYMAANGGLLAFLRRMVAVIALAGPIGAIGTAFAWVAGIAAGAGGIISGAMGMVTMAIRGIGVALMANPLGLILGLATAAFLIYQNWGTLKEWFSSFFSWIGDKFKAVIGWAVDLAKTAGSFLGFGSSDPSGPAGSATTAAALATAAQPEASPATFNSRTPKPLWLNPNADRPSLMAPATRVKASGQIEVSFKDAPPGMRVEPVKGGGDVPINTNVGYRSYAMGMPY